MPPRRVRRPLLALIVLVLAVAVGYLWRAVDSDAVSARGPVVTVTDMAVTGMAVTGMAVTGMAVTGMAAGLTPPALPARHT